MRQILFRGKRVDNGKWIFGGLVQYQDVSEIHTADCRRVWRVNPDTLGQYTGLDDSDGVKIFERDKFKALHDFGPAGFHEREGTVGPIGTNQWEYWLMDTLKVTGNIHEEVE